MANVQTVQLYNQAIPGAGGALLRVTATVVTRLPADPPEVQDGVELSFLVVHPSGRLIPVDERTLMNVRSLRGMP